MPEKLEKDEPIEYAVTKTRHVVQWRTADGRVFNSEEAALRYETALAAVKAINLWPNCLSLSNGDSAKVVENAEELDRLTALWLTQNDVGDQYTKYEVALEDYYTRTHKYPLAAFEVARKRNRFQYDDGWLHFLIFISLGGVKSEDEYWVDNP